MRLYGKNLSFAYDNRNFLFKNIDISLEQGDSTCIFAKSGYGKSTLAKILSGYLEPNTGSVFIDDKPLAQKGFCPVQLIYQHPEKSVNPKLRIHEILNEAGEFDKNLLKRIGLNESCLNRFPYEVSGGQLQRLLVARVFKDETKFIIADEITTMLDAIHQANIWKFVLEQVKDRNIGLLVITHNMHLAKRTCNNIIDFAKLCEKS